MMRRLLILCALLALVAPGCKKKPAEDKAKADGEMMAASMDVAMTPEAMRPVDKRPVDKRPVDKRPAVKLSNLKAVQAGFAAFTAGKLDEAAKNFTAESEWHLIGNPPPRNVLKGKAAAKAYMAMTKKTFGTKTYPTRIFDGGDNIIVEAVSVGVHKADYMGIKASNKPIGFKVAYWFELKDGKVVKVVSYNDAKVVMAQIGAIKGKMAEGVPKAMEAPKGAPQIITGKPDAASLKAAAAMMKIKPTDKAYAKIVDKDTVMSSANGPEMKGLKASLKMHAKMMKMVKDPKMTSEKAIGVGKWAIMRTLDSFTHIKLKKNVKAHRLYIGLFDGGKLKRGIAYENGLEVAAQLGLVPMPGKKGKAGKKADGMKPAPKKGK